MLIYYKIVIFIAKSQIVPSAESESEENIQMKFDSAAGISSLLDSNGKTVEDNTDSGQHVNTSNSKQPDSQISADTAIVVASVQDVDGKLLLKH